VDYGQSLVTNALKHLMDQLEERILQTDQLKNASKRLQHRFLPWKQRESCIKYQDLFVLLEIFKNETDRVLNFA